MPSWTASQNISLDGLSTVPTPVLIQSWDRAPRIRSVMIFNQSSVAIGVFVERAPGAKADLTVGPFTLLSMPVQLCSSIVFALFSTGRPLSGSALITVTEDALAASSSTIAPNALGNFILDQSALNSADNLSS